MENSFKVEKIAITGANSYVGINLIKECIKKKITVHAYCRNPEELSKKIDNYDYLKTFKYKLDDNFIFNFEKIDAVIHLAHERISQPRFKFKSDPNIIGTQNLIDQASKFNLKNIIYLSSHLAHSKTLSQYGKSKFNCEKYFNDKNHVIVKSGIVFGGEPLGFYKLLIKNLKNSKIMPIIFPNAPVYPIHVNDLCKILLHLADPYKRTKNTYYVGLSHPTKLRDFFYRLSVKNFNKKIKFFPLPGNLIYFISLITGYFISFFNSIFERVAGISSLIIVSTEKNLNNSDEKFLNETKSFFDEN